MLKISKDILDSKTHKELKKICEDFDNRKFKNVDYESDNHYVRLFIDNGILQDYISNSKKYLTENLPYDTVKIIDFENTDTWINKVVTETNKNDPYHKDISFLTLITYLNDDFEGGQLAYIDDKGKEQLITPETNMTIIMNDKLSHKVMSVSKGTRFSLITFFKFKEKKNKTLL